MKKVDLQICTMCGAELRGEKHDYYDCLENLITEHNLLVYQLTTAAQKGRLSFILRCISNQNDNLKALIAGVE